MFWIRWTRGHGRYLEQLSEYLDGRLGPEARARIEAHLERCEICLRELESLRETVALLKQLPLVEPGRSFRLREVPAPSPRPGRPVLAWSMQLSTALAAIALAVLLVGDAVGVLGERAVTTPEVPQAEARFAGEVTPEPTVSAATEAVAPAPATAAAVPPEMEMAATELEVEAGAEAPAPEDVLSAAQAEKAVEKEGDGEGDVLRKIEIGVGAFLGLLAAATAYLMFRKRRASFY